MGFKRTLESERDTEAIACELSESLKGKKILLNGELGAGKTTFVKYLAAHMGFFGDISSPTFSIANSYSCGEDRIIHFDLYRLETEEELEATGFYEMIADPEATAVVEWAEKFDLAPYIGRHISITIRALPGGAREFEME